MTVGTYIHTCMCVGGCECMYVCFCLWCVRVCVRACVRTCVCGVYSSFNR